MEEKHFCAHWKDTIGIDRAFFRAHKLKQNNKIECLGKSDFFLLRSHIHFKFLDFGFKNLIINY